MKNIVPNISVHMVGKIQKMRYMGWNLENDPGEGKYIENKKKLECDVNNEEYFVENKI